MLTIRGQRYERLPSVPHVKADGTVTLLTRLRSHCARCGETFTFTATEANVERRMVNRRCHEHARPGVKVRRRRDA